MSKKKTSQKTSPWPIILGVAAVGGVLFLLFRDRRPVAAPGQVRVPVGGAPVGGGMMPMPFPVPFPMPFPIFGEWDAQDVVTPDVVDERQARFAFAQRRAADHLMRLRDQRRIRGLQRQLWGIPAEHDIQEEERWLFPLPPYMRRVRRPLVTPPEHRIQEEERWLHRIPRVLRTPRRYRIQEEERIPVRIPRRLRTPPEHRIQEEERWLHPRRVRRPLATPPEHRIQEEERWLGRIPRVLRTPRRYRIAEEERMF